MADTASTSTLDDQEHQSAFVRTFLIVLGVLVLFTLFCMFVARILSSAASGVENDPILKADVANRIAPVGSVRTTADAAEGSAGAVQVAAVQSGEEIVQGVCAACHISGVGGAPLLDDEAAWASRRELGLDALTASVINGKGAMPARAGTQLSDDELRSAVAAMAGIEIEDAAAEPTADTSTETANTDAAASTEETSGEASDTAATAETETTSTETTTETTAESTSSESDTDASGTATAATAATATAATSAVVQNDAAGATIVAATMTDRIKNTADGVCLACHMSGVGGAPKIGDKDAWAARAEKGLAGMVAVVAAGKGAMPARGGSDLNDEELAAAINYLMAK